MYNRNVYKPKQETVSKKFEVAHTDMKKSIGRKQQPRGDYYTVELGEGAHLDQLEQK